MKKVRRAGLEKIFLSVFFAAVMCSAAPGNPAVTNNPVRGLRIFTCGHSFHGFVPAILADIAVSAGIKDHKQVGSSGIGGSWVIQHWDVPDEKNDAKRLLRAGGVDVLTLSPIWLPDAGIEKFGELAYQHNPNVRILINEFWLPNDVYDPTPQGREFLKTKEIVNHNAATVPALEKQQEIYCREMQQHLDGLNTRLGKNIYSLVPVGHAVIALREKIMAGQAPGLKTQEELFRDNWGHPQMPIQVLSAYCFYACIYQRSPVGLPPVEKWGLDAKLVRLLQELARDAVTNHPSAGLTANN
ncbi:MAG: hypothetical protein WC701_01265 [Kiritimatiellales bacterium]|jgi:hypothetical protein